MPVYWKSPHDSTMSEAVTFHLKHPSYALFSGWDSCVLTTDINGRYLSPGKKPEYRFRIFKAITLSFFFLYTFILSIYFSLWSAEFNRKKGVAAAASFLASVGTPVSVSLHPDLLPNPKQIFKKISKKQFVFTLQMGKSPNWRIPFSDLSHRDKSQIY